MSILSNNQKNEIEKLITEVGNNCILKYYDNLKQKDIEFKNNNSDDPVSIADKTAEKLLISGLSKIIPNSVCIGEESYSQDNKILENLTLPNTYIWIIDPIDGTNNFINRINGFGPMVCLFFNKKTLASFNYKLPSKTLTTFYSDTNEVKIDNKTIESKVNNKLKYKGHIGRKIYKNISSKVDLGKLERLQITNSTSSYPSILAYNSLITEKLDFLIYKITYPWDHLPGLALVNSQNMRYCNINGKEFDFTNTKDGLVVARNEEVLDLVLKDIVSNLN